MTRKNKPEVKRHTKHPEGYPVGTVIEEFWDGSKEITYLDGAKEFVDAQGKSLTNSFVVELEKFLEDLKKNPKDRVLQEYTKAYFKKAPYIEDDKTTAKDILDKIAELTVITIPTKQLGIASITINIATSNSEPFSHTVLKDRVAPEKIKDIEAKVID